MTDRDPLQRSDPSGCTPQIATVASLSGWPGRQRLASCNDPTHDRRWEAGKWGSPVYFPTSSDSNFPDNVGDIGITTSPLTAFDVADLDSGIGSTSQLRDAVVSRVKTDYCEFKIRICDFLWYLHSYFSLSCRFSLLPGYSKCLWMNTIACGKCHV